MKLNLLFPALITAVAVTGCGSSTLIIGDKPNYKHTYDFSQQGDSWEVAFSDYPVGEETFYELGSEQLATFELKAGGQDKGLKITGNNHSDDLFMYMKTPISYLAKNHMYSAKISFTLASNIGEGCFGIGGSPGSSVYIKTGVTVAEPDSVVKDNMYRMNIDIGSQSNAGDDSIVVGNYVAEGLSCVENKYAFITYTNEDQPIEVITDNKGKLWLYMGLDSGFEGITTTYISSYSIELTAL